MMLRNEPGWTGVFTREQVEGAYRNGTRIEKVDEDPGGDIHPKGSRGVVLGSISAAGHVAYFIEWDAHPKVATMAVSQKVIAVE